MKNIKSYKGISGVAAFLIIIVVLGILLAVSFFTMYNRLVKLQAQVEKQQANVETVLQRRYDLIPSLVNSVKGIFDQEEDIVEKVTSARKDYLDAPAGSDQKIEAASELEGALSQFLVVVESYPELRSSENVQNLMDELAGTENRIATERKRYNEDATDYNTALRVFPTNLIAGLFGFEEEPLFEAEVGAEEAPEVDLTD